MSLIKNVAVVGAGGALGVPVLKALIDSGKFNVTVIARPDSKSTFPSSANVIRADYTSMDSLISALKGQDALVLTIGLEGSSGQLLLIDAAIAAAQSSGSSCLRPKVATRKYLEDKVAAGADITYTYVVTSVFLDWALEVTLLLDWKSAEPPLYNGGEFEFSATTLASVAQAVVGVLSHPEETKNRPVYVQDIVISQKKLLDLARKVAPERKWTPITVSLDEQKKWADEKWAEGNPSPSVVYTYVRVAAFQDGHGGRLEKLDNELLGVKGKTDADVEAIWENCWHNIRYQSWEIWVYSD
ncbi:oxidoreductase [Botrytis cinerea]